jgi:hypothetical protein
LLLAVTIGVVYYVVNSNDARTVSSTADDYRATAIFKLTATKQAILGTSELPATLPILQPTLTPTIPPTNTRHAETATPP